MMSKIKKTLKTGYPIKRVAFNDPFALYTYIWIVFNFLNHGVTFIYPVYILH